MPQTHERDHNHHGTTRTIIEKTDVQIRLKCIELAIEAGAKHNPYLTTKHMSDAENIYRWVTGGPHA